MGLPKLWKMTSGAVPGVLRLTVGSFEAKRDSGKSGTQAFAQVSPPHRPRCSKAVQLVGCHQRGAVDPREARGICCMDASFQ